MIDIELVKANNDLAAVVEASLGAPRRTSGCRLFWLCPWHDDHDPSLEVNTQQQRWYCPPCQLTGDVIAWVMRREGVDFSEACGRLGTQDEGPERAKPQQRTRACKAATGPPGLIWQQRARSFVAYAQEQLWGEAGVAGLTYLGLERGLTEETIRRWKLGWNPKPWWDEPQRWGLDGKRIWLPRGVVIPCEVESALWYVKIRCFGAEGRALAGSGQKYAGPRGGRMALHGLDLRQGREVAAVCESEFDAMLLWQESGKVGRPLDILAVGGAGHRLEARWLDYLTQYARLVVAFDLDSAGQEACARWLSESDRVRKAVIPKLSAREKYDLTDFWHDGGRLHDWADYHVVRFYELEHLPSAPVQAESSPEPPGSGDHITLLWPADAKVATIKGHWRRLDTGQIEATYTRDQLELCLAVTHGRDVNTDQMIIDYAQNPCLPARTVGSSRLHEPAG